MIEKKLQVALSKLDEIEKELLDHKNDNSIVAVLEEQDYTVHEIPSMFYLSPTVSCGGSKKGSWQQTLDEVIILISVRKGLTKHGVEARYTKEKNFQLSISVDGNPVLHGYLRNSIQDRFMELKLRKEGLEVVLLKEEKKRWNTLFKPKHSIGDIELRKPMIDISKVRRQSVMQTSSRTSGRYSGRNSRRNSVRHIHGLHRRGSTHSNYMVTSRMEEENEYKSKEDIQNEIQQDVYLRPMLRKNNTYTTPNSAKLKAHRQDSTIDHMYAALVMEEETRFRDTL